MLFELDLKFMSCERIGSAPHMKHRLDSNGFLVSMFDHIYHLIFC